MRDIDMPGGMTPTDKPRAPVLIAAGKSEAELAAELKAEAIEAVKPLLAVMAKARKAGLLLQWDNIVIDAYGREQVNGLKLIKTY